jgi:hypothetical protein
VSSRHGVPLAVRRTAGWFWRQQVAHKEYSLTCIQSLRALTHRTIPYVLIVVIGLAAILPKLDVYPKPWLDEGVRTNAARTLAERGIFGTYSSTGIRAFDPQVTSGPIDVAAVAISFKLLGTGVIEGRLGMLPFALLAMIGIFEVASYIYGRKVGLLVTTMLLAAPMYQDVRLLFVGRQVLGEVPSVSMILAGLYLWFQSWKSNRTWPLVILAGLLLGLGLLSKTSHGIALLPAISIIGLLRWRARRSDWFELVLLIGLIGSVLIGWRILEYLLTPRAEYVENAATLADAVRTLILTWSWGRLLSGSGLLLTGIMLLGATSSLWRLARDRHAAPVVSDAQWAEATLALLALGYAAWYALMSIGWLRYAFFGATVGLLLIIGSSGDALRRLSLPAGPMMWERSRTLYYVVVAITIVAAIMVNLWPAFSDEGNDAAMQMAHFIDKQIPPQAVIESWDWELDALTGHWKFHHPSVALEYLAARQRFMEHIDFNLGYDPLQADPDYLVEGPFSDWTKIYDTRLVQEQFILLTEIGPYRLYGRSRR